MGQTLLGEAVSLHTIDIASCVLNHVDQSIAEEWCRSLQGNQTLRSITLGDVASSSLAASLLRALETNAVLEELILHIFIPHNMLRYQLSRSLPRMGNLRNLQFLPACMNLLLLTAPSPSGN